MFPKGSRTIAVLVVAGALLLSGGCAKRAPNSLPLSSFRTEYQTWTCSQLADEADLLSDALAVAKHGSRTASGDETVAHIEGSMAAVQKASAMKNCPPAGRHVESRN